MQEVLSRDPWSLIETEPRVSLDQRETARKMRKCFIACKTTALIYSYNRPKNQNKPLRNVICDSRSNIYRLQIVLLWKKCFVTRAAMRIRRLDHSRLCWNRTSKQIPSNIITVNHRDLWRFVTLTHWVRGFLHEFLK